jgi:hypothetical protein
LTVVAPHPLSAAELLDAASVCRGRSPVEKGVYLAALGLPGHSFGGCATLPIGERDAAITSLRQAMFGDRLELSAICPQCEARLDVAMNAAALLAIGTPVAPESPGISIDGDRFVVRPADSGDLAAIGGIPDPDTARAELARRCLVPLDGAGLPARLDEEGVDAVGAAMAEIDPAGDPFVALHCAICGLDWDAPLDIADIFAGEIEGAADALLDEIHQLAREYHWSETAILALSQERRSAYLARLQP